MNSESLLGHLFSVLAKSGIQAIGGAIDDSRPNPGGTSSRTIFAVIKILLVLCAILSFIGVEAVKMVFRKNFGSKGINYISLILCIIIFFLIGAIVPSLVMQQYSEPILVIFGVFSFVFYVSLAIYLIKKGYKHWKNNKNIKNINYYEGESYLLKNLLDKGWSEKKVQNLAEPIATILFGVCSCLLLGPFCLPIIFCGFSVWIYQLVAKLFKFNAVKDVIKEQGHKRDSSFTYVR